MSELSDWINQLHMQGAFTIPEQGGGVAPIQAPPPGEDTTRTQPTQPTPTAPDQTRTPDVAAPPPPEAGPPAAPLSPVLRNFLLQQFSGHNVMTPEMYQLYGGDEILQQVQKFDPNARWTMSDLYGGEGGGGGQGMRLDFDPRLIPSITGPIGGNQTMNAGLWKPVYDNDQDLRVREMQYQDPYYGAVTPYWNKYKAQDPWWTYAAPLAVSMVAPWAAGLAAGAGVGGAAGLTAATTGSGLAAGSAAQFAQAPWYAQAAARAGPGTVGRTISGVTQPQYEAPRRTTAADWNAAHPSTGNYNPQAYNNMGNSPAPNRSDSSLVATDFADDPYGMSRRRT